MDAAKDIPEHLVNISSTNPVLLVFAPLEVMRSLLARPDNPPGINSWHGDGVGPVFDHMVRPEGKGRVAHGHPESPGGHGARQLAVGQAVDGRPA